MNHAPSSRTRGGYCREKLFSGRDCLRSPAFLHTTFKCSYPKNTLSRPLSPDPPNLRTDPAKSTTCPATEQNITYFDTHTDIPKSLISKPFPECSLNPIALSESIRVAKR